MPISLDYQQNDPFSELGYHHRIPYAFINNSSLSPFNFFACTKRNEKRIKGRTDYEQTEVFANISSFSSKI